MIQSRRPAQDSKGQIKRKEGAKNPEVDSMYNCGILSNQAIQVELENDPGRINWNVMGISEDLNSDKILYYQETSTGRKSGVGFLARSEKPESRR